MLSNFKEFVDSHLQCSICTELILGATSIDCGHTYCEECIEQWREKRGEGEIQNCPICRADITHSPVPNTLLENYVEKVVDNFFPADAKLARAALIVERARMKTERETRLAQLDEERRQRRREEEHHPQRREGNHDDDFMNPAMLGNIIVRFNRA